MLLAALKYNRLVEDNVAHETWTLPLGPTETDRLVLTVRSGAAEGYSLVWPCAASNSEVLRRMDRLAHQGPSTAVVWSEGTGHRNLELPWQDARALGDVADGAPVFLRVHVDDASMSFADDTSEEVSLHGRSFGVSGSNWVGECLAQLVEATGSEAVQFLALRLRLSASPEEIFS